MVRSLPKSIPAAAVALLLLFVPHVAGATLIGQTIGVRLTNGGSLSRSQNVVAASTGPEIVPGDGSPIGGVLLPKESVDIGPLGISLSLEEGAPSGATGYPSGTDFTFSHLVYFDKPTQIVNINVTTTNLTLGKVTFTPDSVTVPVDTARIGDIPGIDVGSLTITLDVVAVPEPATWTLVAAGIVLLRCARRSRARTR